MSTKKCYKCGEELPIDNFYKDKTKKSGYKSRCKNCISEDNKERKNRKIRLKKDYYRTKYNGYRTRIEKIYPYPLKKKYYLVEGNYYKYRESFHDTEKETIIMKILTVENKPEKNTCNFTFKQIKPLKNDIIEWSIPLSSLRQKWKYTRMTKSEVIREVGEKNIK